MKLALPVSGRHTVRLYISRTVCFLYCLGTKNDLDIVLCKDKAYLTCVATFLHEGVAVRLLLFWFDLFGQRERIKQSLRADVSCQKRELATLPVAAEVL